MSHLLRPETLWIYLDSRVRATNLDDLWVATGLGSPNGFRWSMGVTLELLSPPVERSVI